jgi:hypothetical protein
VRFAAARRNDVVRQRRQCRIYGAGRTFDRHDDLAEGPARNKALSIFSVLLNRVVPALDTFMRCW